MSHCTQTRMSTARTSGSKPPSSRLLQQAASTNVLFLPRTEKKIFGLVMAHTAIPANVRMYVYVYAAVSEYQGAIPAEVRKTEI